MITFGLPQPPPPEPPSRDAYAVVAALFILGITLAVIADRY